MNELQTTIIKAQIPSWCPVCEEASGTKYPYALPGHVVGCQGCGSIWTREALIEIQRKREEALQR